MGYHDPIERVASWLSPAVPEDADIVIGVDGGSADGCVAMTVFPFHDPVWIDRRSFEIDKILRFFSAPPHRLLTPPCVYSQPEPLTPDEIAAFKAKWEALKIGIPRCHACGCPERTQSHCDRWDCPHLLPDRSGEVA